MFEVLSSSHRTQRVGACQDGQPLKQLHNQTAADTAMDQNTSWKALPMLTWQFFVAHFASAIWFLWLECWLSGFNRFMSRIITHDFCIHVNRPHRWSGEVLVQSSSSVTTFSQGFGGDVENTPALVLTASRNARTFLVFVESYTPVNTEHGGKW
jgi:hypothetical protein